MATPSRSASRPERSKPAKAARASAGSPGIRPGALEVPESALPGPVDVIVVGYSPAAQTLYFPALRNLELAGAVRIRAVVGNDEDARNLCLQTFPTADEASSLDAVVVPPGALVILATPPRFHPAQASAAFKRGWHVFSQSPLAATARDAAAMIAAAERHERLLAVDLHRRSFASARYLRALCRDQLLGPAIRFSIHEGAPLSLPATPLSTTKVQTPDGVLADIGLHALDLVTWCFGAASVITYSDDAMGGVEANACADLSFAEGVRGSIHLSRDWPTSESCEFVFERAIVRWNIDDANRLTVQLASAPAAIAGSLVTPSPLSELPSLNEVLPNRAEAIANLLKNVTDAIAGREKLHVPAAEALHALPLMEECYARRTLIEQPWLTPNETAHARSLSIPSDLRRL